MQGMKNGWTRYNNKWLELLSKIARAYKTDFTYQASVWFMNVQLFKNQIRDYTQYLPLQNQV